MKNKYFEINSNGCNVRCKLYYNDINNIENIVVFGHGFGGHKDNGVAQKFAEHMIKKNKNCALITFNWPCHGDDVRKKLGLDVCAAYLETVTAYLKDTYKGCNLYAYATSFGGYLFLKYIAESGSPFAKIALRCPAINMYDVLTNSIIKKEELQNLIRGKDIAVGFDRKVNVSRAFLEELKENSLDKLDYSDCIDDILIMHGTSDEIVPFTSSEKFAGNNVIKFIPVDGADHRFINPKHLDMAHKLILDYFDMKS